MIILGIALVIVALAVGTFVAIGDAAAEDVTLTAFGLTVTTPVLVLFLAGAGTLLVLGLGLSMIRSGTRRSMRTRQEMQRLRRVEAEAAARQAAPAASAVPAASAAPAADVPAAQTPPVAAGRADADGLDTASTRSELTDPDGLPDRAGDTVVDERPARPFDRERGGSTALSTPDRAEDDARR